MKDQRWWLDMVIRWVTGAPEWTEAVSDCQHPKAILFETGTGDTPMQSQIRQISLARIDDLVIAGVPAEVTTMAARRMKANLRQYLGSWVRHIVIAGYTNGFAGYITTPEEYDSQQYEGGHTLHGKWSLAAYNQTLSGLARALDQDQPVAQDVIYDDWRGQSVSHDLTAGYVDELPTGRAWGDVLGFETSNARPGGEIAVEFVTGNPSTDWLPGNNYVFVERQDGDVWQAAYQDMDWSTLIRWREQDGGFVARVTWAIPQDAMAGRWRVRFIGQHRMPGQETRFFDALSPEFRLINGS